jgi:hypothetical protein
VPPRRRRAVESRHHATPRTPQRGRIHRGLIAVAVIALGLAGAEFYALRNFGAVRAPAPEAPAATRAEVPAGAFGVIDRPLDDTVIGTSVAITGWALDRSGVRSVDIMVDGRSYAARRGLKRTDVAEAKPGYPDSAAAGFIFEGDFADLTLDRHEIAVVVTGNDGKATTIARRSLVPPAALTQWRTLLDGAPSLATRRFYFLMMTSGIGLGGANGIGTEHRDYVSRTQRVGMSVPILYLRMTTGAADDWKFDANFDLARQCGTRPVAEDNLAGVIRHAIAQNVPVQFILNGGIWGDASCAIPQWDLTDPLETDRDNDQWSQDNEVFPDDYLKGLSGSTTSPELARSLTYNVYATKVRAYKRRNLQAAAAQVAAFAREHPDLFVGIVLDSDTYMNPFFQQKEFFDYNPGMLRQFREWLAGSGAYAGRPRDGAPDLSAYRRARPLALAEVNRLAHRNWSRWDQVDPPRRFPGSTRDPEIKPGEQLVWNDRWYAEWDMFRKRVIDLHYDELSTWAREAGIPRDRIFSAQGFLAPDEGLKPFAVRLASHGQNYDSAGVSVEGAVPRDGHLGVILYGEAAVNDVRMEERHSLFATFARMDEGWAIVEYNNTDLKAPSGLPTYVQAYRSFRDAYNFGAREISVMAWNGSNGLGAGQPGFLAYTAWRNTPAESAMRDFLVARADLPWGAKLWTFGTPRHVDGDGWTAERGTLGLGSGWLAVNPEQGRVTLLSPPDQVLRPAAIGTLLLRFAGTVAPQRIKAWAHTEPNGAWREIGTAQNALEIKLTWPPGLASDRNHRRAAARRTRVRAGRSTGDLGARAALSRGRIVAGNGPIGTGDAALDLAAPTSA